MSDIPTVSNVRQDLTQWQATHAKLMLATVKVRSVSPKVIPVLLSEVRTNK